MQFFVILPDIPLFIQQVLTVLSMGYFKNTRVWGGHYGHPFVTLLFLKVEGQNLATSGILVCFLQKWH